MSTSEGALVPPELRSFLEGIGFGQYVEKFVENGIDVDLLPDLTNEDLKDLGDSPPGRPQAIAKGDSESRRRWDCVCNRLS